MEAEKLISDIINNFRRQQQFYMQMNQLSKNELDLLQKEWNGDTEKLNRILEERTRLIPLIDDLNRVNREYQEQVKKLLGLEGFLLSQLKPVVAETQYRGLEEILIALSGLLAEIEALDQQSKELIDKQLGSKKLKARINPGYAQQQYNQVRDQGKR